VDNLFTFSKRFFHRTTPRLAPRLQSFSTAFRSRHRGAAALWRIPGIAFRRHEARMDSRSLTWNFPGSRVGLCTDLAAHAGNTLGASVRQRTTLNLAARPGFGSGSSHCNSRAATAGRRHRLSDGIKAAIYPESCRSGDRLYSWRTDFNPHLGPNDSRSVLNDFRIRKSSLHHRKLH